MALYCSFFLKVFNKEIDLDSDALKVALSTNAHTPNQDTHDYFDDVTNEITGTGYTAGGAVIGSVTVTLTGASNLITVDGADVSWTGATFTARNYHAYDSSPATAATRPLIQYETFGADVTVTGATFTIQWNAAGIFTVTVS